jgi:predicted fused transcriptional regulator/phosphomethylpyrimidine kinase
LGENGLWFEPAPYFLTASTAITHPSAARMSIPCEHQRFKTVPPIGVNIAAAAFKAEKTESIVKSKFHGQIVALFESGASRRSFGVFTESKAAAHMIGRNNPAHD